MSQKWLRQTDPNWLRVTPCVTWGHSEVGPRESLLSHAWVTSVLLGARPILNSCACQDNREDHIPHWCRVRPPLLSPRMYEDGPFQMAVRCVCFFNLCWTEEWKSLWQQQGLIESLCFAERSHCLWDLDSALKTGARRQFTHGISCAMTSMHGFPPFSLWGLSWEPVLISVVCYRISGRHQQPICISVCRYRIDVQRAGDRKRERWSNDQVLDRKVTGCGDKSITR